MFASHDAMSFGSGSSGETTWQTDVCHAAQAQAGTENCDCAQAGTKCCDCVMLLGGTAQQTGGGFHAAQAQAGTKCCDCVMLLGGTA
eukprot:1161950-Pelagomonas_calceolata.AAC.2